VGATIAPIFLWHSDTSADPVEYSITDLGALPGYQSCRAHGLNDLAQVVGYCKDPTIVGPEVPFIWDNGIMVPLITLPSFPSSTPMAINNGGQAVGYATDESAYRAVLWSDNSITDLNDLLPEGSGWELLQAFDINDAGQIVGTGYLNGVMRAYRVDDGTVTDLGTLGGATSGAGGINALGQVVGDAEDPYGESHAYVWEDGVMTPLGVPDCDYSWASDINDTGQIVGSYGSYLGPGTTRHPFLWDAGTVKDLDTTGTLSVSARAINASGQAVGSGLRSGEGTYLVATLWDNCKRHELYDLVPDHDGWLIGLGHPDDINSVGQIVGYSWMSPSDGNEHSYLLTPIVCGDGILVPEEECDDGNTTPGDGCDESCLIELPVPTVSAWGLVAMTLLVLAAGTVVVRRRVA